MWNNELLELCHDIKEERRVARGLTFGVVQIPDDQIDPLLTAARGLGVFSVPLPDDVGGFYGERIKIDQTLPVYHVSIRGYEWVEQRYEVRDGHVFEIPDTNDIGVKLQLSISKGAYNRIDYVQEYSLSWDLNELTELDAGSPYFSTNLFVSACAETGYEGHQLQYRQAEKKFAQQYIDLLKEYV